MPTEELARVQEAQAARPRDVAWLSQQLLKRTELTPKQVAQIQQALRESREGPALPRGEAQPLGEAQEGETLLLGERGAGEPKPLGVVAGAGPGASAAEGGIETRLVAAAAAAADAGEGPPQERVETREAAAKTDRREAVTLELRRGRPELGQVIRGRFELQAELGRGAQGLVYRAWDRRLERDVAVKLLRGDAPGQAQARFEREARLVGQLGHPGIVKVYEAGDEGGMLYFAMELVEGCSLEDLLEQEGALAIQRATRIVEQVARAMHHAHEAGLVHRDLKPANVLLDREETAKVADFGLVTLAEGTRLTVTRGVVGTPVYMAPEQAEGEQIDRRADVYSLGAVLYECLVGQPPFSGATPLEIFRRIVREDPRPPRRIRPEVPELVQAVCLRALEKDPRARYPTALAFSLDLRRALGGQRLAPQRAPLLRGRAERAARTHPLALGLLLGSGLGLLAGLALAQAAQGQRPRPLPPAPRPSQPSLAEQQAARAGRRSRLALARAELARGMEGAAVDWLRTLEATRPMGPEARAEVARARGLEALAELGRNRVAAARRCLSEGMSLTVAGDPLIQVAAATLRGRTGDLAGGLEDVDHVLSYHPGLPMAHLQRAYLLAQLGQGGEALLAAERAVELSEPRPWPVAQLALACFLEREGKLQDAVWALELLIQRLKRQDQLARVDPGLQGKARLRALAGCLPANLRASVQRALDPRSWEARPEPIPPDLAPSTSAALAAQGS